MFDKFKFACIGATGIIFIASYFFVGLHYYRNGYETATKKYDAIKIIPVAPIQANLNLSNIFIFLIFYFYFGAFPNHQIAS